MSSREPSVAHVVALGEGGARTRSVEIRLQARPAPAGAGEGAIIALGIGDPALFAEAYADAWRAGQCPLVLNPLLPFSTMRALAQTAGATSFAFEADGKVDHEIFAADARARAPGRGHLLCTSGTMSAGGSPKLYLFDESAPPGNARAHLSSIGVDVERGEPEHILLPMPITHSFGVVAGLHAAAVTSARLHAFTSTPDPRSILAAAEAHAITTLYLTPTLVRLLLRALARGRAVDLPALARISVGSAPMTRGELLQLARRFPKVPVYFTYGLTELGPRVSTFAGGTGETPSPLLLDDADGAVPIGRPIDGVRWKVTSDEADGRLAVSSPYGALGRWLHGALSPLSGDETGFFVTEDVVAPLDSGDMGLRGRADGAIICGGLNIYPEDVERIVHDVRGVAAACLVGRASALYGEVAVLLFEAEPLADPVELEREILRRVSAALPPTHVPKELVLVRALPRTSMGKVARREAAVLARPVQDAS